MILEGQVGPIVGQDGARNPIRQARDASAVVQDSHGRYQEAVIRGNVFFACNQAGIAAGTGLATAAKNMTLYNPLGSGKNLVLLEITLAMTVIPAADPGAIMLAANLPTPVVPAAPATVTAETVQNALLGGPAGVAKVYNTATLAAAPVAIRNIASAAWVTTGTTTALNTVKDEVAGAIIIPPGCYVSIMATAAVTLQCSMTWEEVPV
jgi:hypothetical protein